MPSKAASHGAPARRYLNEKVTGVLLEGMKRLAADRYVVCVFLDEMRSLGFLGVICLYGSVTARPEDPLRVLGEFLLQRSREVEGTT